MLRLIAPAGAVRIFSGFRFRFGPRLSGEGGFELLDVGKIDLAVGEDLIFFVAFAGDDDDRGQRRLRRESDALSNRRSTVANFEEFIFR